MIDFPNFVENLSLLNNTSGNGADIFPIVAGCVHKVNRPKRSTTIRGKEARSIYLIDVDHRAL